MNLTRRTLLRQSLLAGITLAAPAGVLRAQAPVLRKARIRWIDGAAPPLSLGQTFGVPWPRGRMKPRQAFAAEGPDGPVPVQSWPIATWPDGSLKWTAHALPAGVTPASLAIVPARRRAAPREAVSVLEGDGLVTIRVGDAKWEVPTSGDILVRRASIGGRQVLGPVRLVGAVDDAPQRGSRTELAGRIDKVTVEQRGPVRAVVKIDGVHAGGGRTLLPFSLRLYAYSGAPALRIVHSFIYDGQPTRDFVSALGVSVEVPMRGALHDRHVRMSTGEGALFAEAVRPLTGLRRNPGRAFAEAQVAGKPVPPLAQMDRTVRENLERIPAWSDFTLSQHNANGFTLVKRTSEGHAWIDSDEGRRSPGLAYVGSPEGGAAIGIRYFWQRHPSQFDVRGAATDTATLTGWLWSPDAQPMDLRSYRGVMGMETYEAQNEGLAVTYEDYEPGWDSATGIARTSELTLWALPATPPGDELMRMASAVATPPQLMTEPAYIHGCKVLGIWGLPDRSTPNRTIVENQLANLIDFYEGEVDRRSWYGFWDHGDVMHTYDWSRHQWRYDIGGFAWDNSELSPDLWLWLAALRSGDAKTFRFAEAMTRHTGEVDVYHLGRFKGMGTRHGVQHFSDSSKQPRVSNAIYRRIFYYLTADERTGDLMRDLVTSDQTLQTVVIERKVPGREKRRLPPGTVEMSFGTVWCSLVGAWLTEWERTGNRRWRDRIVAGMESIGAMPRGWFTGGAPFELATGRFVQPENRIAFSHLNAVFGAVEINAEMLQLLDVPSYRKAWLDYCRWYNAPRTEFEAQFGRRIGSDNLKEGHSRLTAFAAHELKDRVLADRAAAEFFSGEAGLGTVRADPRVALPGGIVEWPDVSTNAAAQWGLAAIQNLALIPEAIDRATIPPPDPRRRRHDG